MRKGIERGQSLYTNSDLVLVAVYQLGGSLRHIHLEDVAMQASKLSPKAFCWKKYLDQVNLEAVRIALKNELGLQNSRISGSIRDGWMITPAGLSWCLVNPQIQDNASVLETMRNEVARIKNTSAFRKIIANNEAKIASQEISELLRADEYFSIRARKERLIAIRNTAVLDPQVQIVLDNLQERGFLETEVK